MINAKLRAREFVKKYNFYNPDLKSLYNILAAQGYTRVEYNGIFEDEDVENIINSLNLSEYVKQTRAFTYVDDSLRLVFVNEDLSEEEKLMVLLHEEGHIFCEHFSKANVIGNDVLQEQEANDFAHYILNPGLSGKLQKHKNKIVAVLAVICVLIIGVFAGRFIARQMSYYGKYYLTETGFKYHADGCGYVDSKTNTHRMTKDDFESGLYEPCLKCITE